MIHIFLTHKISQLLPPERPGKCLKTIVQRYTQVELKSNVKLLKSNIDKLVIHISYQFVLIVFQPQKYFELQIESFELIVFSFLNIFQ